MSKQTGVTLQINVAPPDVRYAAHTLPHQLRAWGGQVAEVVFTVDAHRSGWGRGAEQSDAAPLERLLRELCEQYPHARVARVDYSAPTVAAVSAAYFGERRLPMKDFRGAPIYPYFFGLHAASHDLVFHLDADMMFGGGSQSWVAEALRILEREPAVLTCNPLPGPPRADGALRSQQAQRAPEHGVAYRHSHLSARLYLLDRRALAEHSRSLSFGVRRPLKSALKGVLLGHLPFETAEDTLSQMMQARGLARIDFLGGGPGMWSLHPLVRTERYYRVLPELIRAVEAGTVPDAQRGEHDVCDEMLDMLAPARELDPPPA